jgi:cell wall-associated NlpC family hydrolase
LLRLRTIAIIGAGLALVVVLLAGAAAAGLAGIIVDVDQVGPSPQALADIPANYLQLFVTASATCPGLSWTIPAAIGKVESDFGRSTLPGVTSGTNSAGAAGPMQMGITGAAGPTFYAYDHPVPADPTPTPPGGVTPPSPYDPTDAIYAAVRDLCTNGAGNPATLDQAILAYNRSESYVTQVLALALTYQSAPTTNSSAAAAAVAYAQSQLGVPYQWGGETPGVAFDCSGLVQAAYAAAGITLPRVAQDQYNAGPPVPPGEALQPGDLVFFGTSPADITHVGIVLGNGEMIDAPHTGAVVRVEPYNWSDYIGATRPAATQPPNTPT